MNRRERMRCAAVLTALFAVQMLMHTNADNLLLDDWVFYTVRDGGQNVAAYLAQRWQTWSSRLLIEGTLCFLTSSIWAWRVLDSLMMVMMAWSLCRLSGSERRPAMLALSGCLVTSIPFAVLRSTGWMATSLNYYWTLACALAALIPLADALNRRGTGKGLAVLAVLCAVYGANQEQTAALIFGASLVLGATLLARDRRIPPVVGVIFAIAAAELTMHLLCPGNAVRAEQSVALTNLRDYEQFSLIDKLSIGLTSTAALLFFTCNAVLLTNGAIICSTIAARRRGAGVYALAALPAIFTLRAYAADLFRDAQPLQAVNALFLQHQQYSLMTGPLQISGGRLTGVFVTVTMLGLLVLWLYLSIGQRPLAAVAVFVFALGFAARMVLSFSVTVVESGERTMLPFYGAMMLCSLLCVRDCRAEASRRWPLTAAFVLCGAVAAANVAMSFALAA